MTTYATTSLKEARKQLQHDIEKGKKRKLTIYPLDYLDGRRRYAWDTPPHYEGQSLDTGDKLILKTQDGFFEVSYLRSA